MKQESDKNKAKWKIRREVFQAQLQAIRKQYQKEFLSKQRAERDKQILDLHTHVEDLRLRESARFKVMLREQQDKLYRKVVEDRALQKHAQYTMSQMADQEYDRLSQDKKLLDHLEAESRQFVTLEGLEEHLERELGKFVGVQGAVNSFGMQVLPEDDHGHPAQPMLQDLGDDFEEVTLIEGEAGQSVKEDAPAALEEASASPAAPEDAAPSNNSAPPNAADPPKA
jgi:hypothetical protein